MFVAAALVPDWLLWLGNALAALLLGWSLWRAPWGVLRQAENHNVLFGFCVVLLLVWTIRAGTGPDPRVHILGATTFAFMFGRYAGVLALNLVLLGMTLAGAVDPVAFGVNALVNAFLPVWFADRFRRAVERWLPHHFFVYIFVAAFFGAALAFAVTAASTYGVLLWADGGSASGGLFSDQFVPMVLLLMFGEAWLNGMAMTIFVVMRPQWVATFDDQRYLAGK